MKSHLGAPKAITATAHKLARLVYSMLKNGEEYVSVGIDEYNARHKERQRINFEKMAARLGYEIIPQKANPEVALAT
jgi:hypothetical protein